MDFDALIIGGGAAGLSCALVLGSALNKEYAAGKKVGIIMHQKASHLQSAKLYNVLGVEGGIPGAKILKKGPEQLAEYYPAVEQIKKEKLIEIAAFEGGFKLISNKKHYTTQIAVISLGYTHPLRIKGLESYIIPHQKAKASKNRIQLKNEDHLVLPNLYVAGTLAGERSQFAIASGSGAAVATDILTLWNNGEHTKVHDKMG